MSPHRIRLRARELCIQADKALPSDDGILLRGGEVSVELPFAPVRFYRHGWQSWSLTMWQGAGQKVPEPLPRALQPMQVDPVYARDPSPNGSWVGAVEGTDGSVLLLGALDLETHVALEGGRLVGRSETGTARWLLSLGGEEDVFGLYAARLRAVFGKGRAEKPPRIWCSWYSLYTAIRETVLHRILEEIRGMPFDVFQVDDGWQDGIGDWEANAKFPSGMEALASRIRAAGFTPGLWLAPLLSAPSSRLFREHPDWMLRDAQGRFVSAGFNWGAPVYALDATHPGALAWLTALLRRVRAWGFGYAKLDFLYAGALPGVRHNGMAREAAYRHVLAAVREALGDAYFLACGAPVIPSIGLCDGLRVGPDVAASWESARDGRMLTNCATPGARNAVRTTVHRLWLRDLLHMDPDAAYFRSRRIAMDAEHRRLLVDLALVCGFRATSDPPSWLGPEERAGLLGFLDASPRVERRGRGAFSLDGRRADFSAAMELPAPLPLLRPLVGRLAGRKFALRLFDVLGRRGLERMMREEFGEG